jgi:hypothetical protein
MGQQDMEIAPAAVNALMPMHLWLLPDGRIRSVGTTLHKVVGSMLLENAGFFDLFEVRRPGGIFTVDDLRRRAGERLSIVPHRIANVQNLRGIAVALGGGAVFWSTCRLGLALLRQSLGIS